MQKLLNRSFNKEVFVTKNSYKYDRKSQYNNALTLGGSYDR